MKKLLLGFFTLMSFLFAPPAFSMQQMIVGGVGSSGTVSNSVTHYISPVTQDRASSTTEANVQALSPISATFGSLNIRLSGSPGSGKSFLFTLRKNGADTTLTCTVADTNTTCSDTTHTVSMAPGDVFSVSSVPSGTPTARSPFISMVVDSASSTIASMYSTNSNGVNMSNSATRYCSINALLGGGFSATESQANVVIPQSGTIKNLYVNLQAAPGAGKSYTFTVRKNGSDTVVTTGAVTGASTTTGNDTTHSVTVAAGDVVTISIVPSGTPTATTVQIAVEFDSDKSSYFMLVANSISTTTDNTAARYLPLTGGWQGFQTSAANYANIQGPVYYIKRFFVNTPTAPDNGGGTQQYTVALYNQTAGAATAASCVISEAQTACNYTLPLVSAAAQANNFIFTPSGTPAVTTASVSIAATLDPTSIDFYASPSGGGAASCIDNSTNVCTLQRAIVVAATTTANIELANGTYACSTACVFDSTNLGATLSFFKASGATVTVGSTGSNYVFDIQPSMVSGNVTFNNIGITETDTDHSVANRAPEVNLTYTGSTITNSDASAGDFIYSPLDTTNTIAFTTGEDTVTNLKTGATTNTKVAQKIVPGANVTVNRAALKIKRRCGNKGTTCNQFVSGQSWDYRNNETLTVTIETDNAGAPSGTPVTNGTATTRKAFDVPYIADEWYSFTFPTNVSLTSGTTYWLVITGSYTASTTNYIEIDTDTGNGYAAGDSATFDGTNWTVATNNDLMFSIDRAHTRTLTLTGNTVTTRNYPIQSYWDDTITVDSNTITSTGGGILSLNATNQSPTADDAHKRVVVSNNVIDAQTDLSLFINMGVNTQALTWTGAVIAKGNTGTISLFSQPYEYIHKLLIYGNTMTVLYAGNVPFKLGKEVDGSDPQEIPYHPFDQVIIENNNFTFSAASHNHLFLLGIGSEGGIMINNTIRAPNSSGAGGGGWGIIDKASFWTIIGNKVYGPGPCIYFTNNHSISLYNTCETYDSSGSNAAILFRDHQDAIYGGTHGIPMFNFVENNVFISNGSYAGLTHCDNTNCSTGGGSTLGTGRTEPFWSNRIDNNLYYARNYSTTANMQIGSGTSLENVTLAEGIATARATWVSSTYSDKNSIAQYNDIQNSIIALPSGIDGINGIFTTADPNIIGKGTVSGTSIGGYQLAGSLASGPFGTQPFGDPRN